MSAQKIKVYSETAKELELLFRPYNKFQLDGLDGTCDCAIDMDGLTNSAILAGRVIKPSSDKDVFIIDNGDGKSGEGDDLLYEESGAFKFAKFFADRSGQIIPTEISDGLKDLEDKKDQPYAAIFAPAEDEAAARASAEEEAAAAAAREAAAKAAASPEEPPPGQVRGVVIDATTGTPIAGAVVSFPNTDKTNLSTGAGGNFLSYDFPPGDLMIRITHPRYENFEVTTVVTVEAGRETPLEFKLIPLPPELPEAPSLVEITEEGKIELKRQIHFESDKRDLHPDSAQLLDDVVTLLTEHSEITKVEIGGHTDSNGKDKKNLKLSQDRADEVLKYLIKQGINSARLTAMGYGETRLITTGNTPEDHKQNRRIEFKILEPAPTAPK